MCLFFFLRKKTKRAFWPAQYISKVVQSLWCVSHFFPVTGCACLLHRLKFSPSYGSGGNRGGSGGTWGERRSPFKESAPRGGYHRVFRQRKASLITEFLSRGPAIFTNRGGSESLVVSRLSPSSGSKQMSPFQCWGPDSSPCHTLSVLWKRDGTVNSTIAVIQQSLN